MKRTILADDKNYTFSDYFYLPNPTKEVVAEFGYEFRLQKLDLPTAAIQSNGLSKLRDTFYKKLPHISLTSETAKREFLVSPLFFELLDYIDVNIDVEYPVAIDNKLKGSFDYLIRSTHNLIVVEAKNADLEKGFTQLAVELIALDKYLDDADNVNDTLYGAVTVGDIWRFGSLNRQVKLVLKDIDAFLVPSDLEALFAVFLGILNPDQNEWSALK